MNTQSLWLSAGWSTTASTSTGRKKEWQEKTAATEFSVRLVLKIFQQHQQKNIYEDIVKLVKDQNYHGTQYSDAIDACPRF